MCCGQCKWWDYRGVRQDFDGEMRDHGKCLNPNPRCSDMVTDIDDLCDENLFAQKDEDEEL